MIEEWNRTETDYARDQCIHEAFSERAALMPDAPAVACDGNHITYGELDRRSNQLARYLRKRGVGTEELVGIYMDRSIDLVVGLLGVLKAGAAYVPLDPSFPESRVAFMVQDSKMSVVLTELGGAADPAVRSTQLICLDTDWQLVAREPDRRLAHRTESGQACYVIYTSGSTGTPKGVVVEHRNVLNFFAGMDAIIPHDPPGTWLAVTTLSFDISVLEIFWTLARGFHVVLYREPAGVGAGLVPAATPGSRPIDFSLFYFASDDKTRGQEDKYRLLMEGARFADEHGFAAVWTPERHFHAFGGAYPNPAVTGAAIAAVTERVGIRAGSCVLPLHNPIRVAEEWAVVDNLSNGRVGISFASGWQPNDFLLQPEHYAERKRIMEEGIETVRALWRGDSVALRGPGGKDVQVRTLPRPVQPELPVWITAAGSPETFLLAGERGFHILTHLLGQSIEELGQSLAVYREAWRTQGHTSQGRVTVMLHTLVGSDVEAVRSLVRQPLTDYLRSSAGLIKEAAWSSPRFQPKAEAPLDPAEDDMEALLDLAFSRYFERRGLFGTPQTCLDVVNELKGLGVDEIACLIDFGVDEELVLQHLEPLRALKEAANPSWRTGASRLSSGAELQTLSALIRHHGVTHFQCTPSLAGILVRHKDTRAALVGIRTFLVGGETLTESLAESLAEALSGDLINVYGPTETTIWSTAQRIRSKTDGVSIGRPIANTRIYLLDEDQQPVPQGRPGEVFIGGEGVARGYLNRPKLTTERFVPDPFTESVGARMYRTGDLARYRNDGALEFLGRLDHQVKIRGHRIELGEIESVLRAHQRLSDAVVSTCEFVTIEDREVTGPDKRLVAYVIAVGADPPTSHQLRSYLLERIPSYMVPSAFVFLDAFPLTPNRKVDRKALPDPQVTSPVPDRDQRRPQSATEKGLAEIFSRVLGVEDVSVDDGFFELGGHSLLAMQIVADVVESFQRRVPLATFFQHPTVRELAKIVDEQSPAFSESPLPPAAPIATGAGFEVFPASFSQQRLWFLDQLEGGGTATYNIPAAYRISGPLDVHVLERSLNESVHRHESLRTTLDQIDGQPVQIVSPPHPLPLEHVDLSDLPDSDRLVELDLRLKTEAARAFDLREGPLMRATLYQIGPDEHVLLLVVHHIVSDGWSMRILERELSATYSAFEAGYSAPLPLPPIRYADYSMGQDRRLRDGALEQQAAYWRSQLEDIAPQDLPTDRRRPRVQTFQGRQHTFVIDMALTNRLRALTQTENATLFMVMLAVFKVLLHRYSSQADIAVGVPIANRTAPQTEDIVGFFVNTLVMRTDLSGNPKFRDLLARTRKVALEAYENQDLPFVKVVEKLQPERDLSRSPLFQALFQVQTGTRGVLQLGLAQARQFDIETVTSKFDLSLSTRESDGLLHCTLEYNTDLFDRDRIERMADHYRILLDGVVCDPDAPIGLLPLLTEDEAQPMQAEWTGTEHRLNLSLHELFEAQVVNTPDAVAITFGGAAITYSDLNRRSNQMAHSLLRQGMQKGQRVAILLEDGPQQPVALFAALKAGGVFVCLDANYPTRRLKVILEEVQPAFAVLDSRCLSRHEELLHSLGCDGVLLVDGMSAARTAGGRVIGTTEIAAGSDANPGVTVDPADPCYIVYTSGSNGKPKGLQQSHRSFCQFIDWQSRYFDIKHPQRFAQWASTAYDASYRQIFGTLCFGATLCMAPASVRLNPRSLVSWIQQERVTVLNLVPGFCREVTNVLQAELADGSPCVLPYLEKLLLTGEVLSVDLASTWQALFPEVLLFNLYGPSEAVLATCHAVPPVGPMQRSIPVGEAIDGRQILILDQYQQPVPIGVGGEIYIRSPYLTDGYIEQPDETAARFLQNPLHNNCADPVYRTGDIGFWLANGQVEFLGRNDNLVKLAGQRVELGDIESHVREHSAVCNCAVVVGPYRRNGATLIASELHGPQESNGGGQVLIAYYTAESELPGQELRAFLSTSLPRYMIPQHFVWLQELPYNANHKLDLAALPEPPAVRPELVRPSQGRRTEVEKTLVRIWSEVLELDNVGVFDNFFDLGGHSLRAIQILSRVRDRLGVELPVLSIFAHPTVAGLAEHVRAQSTSQQLGK